MNINNVIKKFKHSTPDMTEELATMMTKYRKQCTRKDIEQEFVENLNKRIYDAARYGETCITISYIPTEVIPHINTLVETLRNKKFHVGVIVEPYPVLAIKWDIPVTTVAINSVK